MGKILSILKQRPFLSVFITQFLGAFNDNIFRAAMSGFVTYKLTTIVPEHKQIIVTLAVGFFMLPFFLFSALAGEIADKFRKDIIFKVTKFCEIVIVSIAVVGFYTHNPYLLLGVLGLMGSQSAFFGPAKYSILLDILEKDELIAGNALFEAGTYMAILQGIILGGLIMSGEGSGLFITAVFIVSVALIGFIASLFIPKINAASPESKINLNFIQSTFKNMKFATMKRNIFLCILGISWFWLIGAILISQIPGFAQNVLNGNGNVYTFLLTMFSCGVGIGAIVCQFLLKGEITSKYVPVSVIFMTVFLADLAWASYGVGVTDAEQTLVQFLTSFSGIRISIDFLMLAVCGGLYMVPLNAMLQVFSGDRIRSRVIATNNIINALFMVLGSAVCVLLLANGFDIAGIFIIMAIANALVTVYICGLLPEHLVRSILIRCLNLVYKVEIKGLENLKKLKGEVVIVANHTSFLDGILLWLYLPSDIFFAINTYVAKEWWIRPIRAFVRYFTLDPTNPIAVKSIIEEVKKKRKVVIFPEGRITTTGSLMKVYPGPAVIADKSDANILPVYIDGSQYSIFGRFSVKLKKAPKIKITMNIFPARKLNVPEHFMGKERRLEAARRLYDLMCEMKFLSSNTNKSLFAAVVDSCSFVGGGKKILEDVTRKPLTFRKLIAASYALGDKLSKQTKKKEYVGLMLPNSNAIVVTFLSLQAYGRVPCMINFTGGIKNILASCKLAKIKTIYTSKEFVERGSLEDVIEALKEEKIKIINLEDIKSKISIFDKISAIIKAKAPLMHLPKVDSHDPAVVLFTSGSEGLPKGVVLSHQNLQSNSYQLASVAPFGILDSIFNAMPVFHSFGLTAGMLLPLLNGMKVFMYPTPLHYRIVPELIYDTEATVMFGTDTFYNGYAKAAHPYDFHSIRFAVAGAEKVREETFRTWTDKFGVRLLEGYGATETSPVLSINLPMNFKHGTVGRLLPSIESKIEKVQGVEEGGRLFVKGPNIMLGYLLTDKPGIIQPINDGWYDTGDIVDIDQDGFIKIIGRAKRFAKIAGEMVSLSAVEASINKLWPNANNAVVSIPDDKKGEQLVLFTTYKNAKRDDIFQYFKASGISDISLPKEINILDEIPVMGSGKTNYVKLGEYHLKE